MGGQGSGELLDRPTELGRRHRLLLGGAGWGRASDEAGGEQTATEPMLSFLCSDAFDQGCQAQFGGVIGADPSFRLNGLAMGQAEVEQATLFMLTQQGGQVMIGPECARQVAGDHAVEAIRCHVIQGL